MEYIEENIPSREELAKKIIEVSDMQDEYKSAIRKGDKEEIRFMAHVYYEARRKLVAQAKSILFNGKLKD